MYEQEKDIWESASCLENFSRRPLWTGEGEADASSSINFSMAGDSPRNRLCTWQWSSQDSWYFGIPRPPFSCPLLDFSVYRLTGMYLSAQGYASVSHLNQNTSLLCLSVSLFFLSHVLPSQLIMKILVPQSLIPSCHMSVIALQIQVPPPLFFVLTLFLQRSLSP